MGGCSPALTVRICAVQAPVGSRQTERAVNHPHVGVVSDCDCYMKTGALLYEDRGVGRYFSVVRSAIWSTIYSWGGGGGGLSRKFWEF